MQTVTLYSGPYCPYCTMAKQLLNQIGVTEIVEIKEKDDPEALTRLAAALEQEQKKVERLNEENVALQNKAMYYDYFCEVGLCTNISTTAKELNIPTKRFVEFLLRGSFLYRTIRGVLLPYSETLTGGLFEVKDFCVNGRHGVYTLITPEGKALFRLLIPERNSNRRAVNAQ